MSLRILIIAAFAVTAPGFAASSKQAPQGTELSDFKIIAERNIFNPKRSPRSTNNSSKRETTRSSRPESLVLTGTIAYEKGTFAFFDGSSSSYKKVVRQSEKVAGFEVREVAPDYVRLVLGTNEFKVPVGSQLQKREDGPWKLAGPAEFAYTPSSSAPTVRPQQQSPPEQPQEQAPSDFLSRVIETALGAGTPPPPPSGLQPPAAGATPPAEASSGQIAAPAASQDEILRRLMQRREQEMNQ